ncbi:hypothetical protein AMATHDRAFT_50731 [Amanita thiersii Skay4041]|uniref:Uncharacterized protein n=1 Tax=Amanita thiersii Skay4041 TaxID=703135 RepID=A0A2A9NGF1_9AGAR|nr:hypothetical protein AMATHDRAFT_50731 [Amanita thiersii Skay4041]
MSFPTELCYEVVGIAWSLPLTPDERIQFMTASKLVSKTWSSVLEDVMETDVHIPCESYYKYFFSDPSRGFARCQTITFTVYEPDRQLAFEYPSCRNLGYMRQKDIARLTSLESMNIVYHNMGYSDPYTQDMFLALPEFLPRLSISYSFSPDVSPSVISSLRRQFKRESSIRYCTPEVGILEISGADGRIVAIWESLFPDREVLVMDGVKQVIPFMRPPNTLDLTFGIYLRLKRIQEDDQPNNISASIRRGRVPKRILKKQVSPYDVSNDKLTTYDLQSLFTSSPARIGQIGYVNKSTGSFEPLFNTLEPHDIHGYSFPSLHGYGEVELQTPRHRIKRVLKSLIRRLRGKHTKRMVENFNTSGTDSAKRWFVVHLDRVARAYSPMGIRKEDLVLDISIHWDNGTFI